jgi:hypothetical protein
VKTPFTYGASSKTARHVSGAQALTASRLRRSFTDMVSAAMHRSSREGFGLTVWAQAKFGVQGTTLLLKQCTDKAMKIASYQG